MSFAPQGLPNMCGLLASSKSWAAPRTLATGRAACLELPQRQATVTYQLSQLSVHQIHTDQSPIGHLKLRQFLTTWEWRSTRRDAPLRMTLMIRIRAVQKLFLPSSRPALQQRTILLALRHWKHSDQSVKRCPVLESPCTVLLTVAKTNSS